MEDDLFRMFRHMDFTGADPSTMMAKLMRMCEMSILQQVKSVVDRRLDELSGAFPKADYEDMNPFKILGVDMNATEEEVRAAYRKAAQKAHPDKGGSDMEMKKVNAAFEVICRFRGWTK